MTLSSTLLPSHSFSPIHAYAWILGKDEWFKQPTFSEFRGKVMIALDNGGFCLAGESYHARLANHKNWQLCGTHSLIRGVDGNKSEHAPYFQKTNVFPKTEF